MGSSQSTPQEKVVVQEKIVEKVVIKEIESAESKEYKELLGNDKQLESLRQEVCSLEPLIIEGIKTTVNTVEDAIVITYKDLHDKKKILETIDTLFPKFPVKDFLIDTAKNMVAAMDNSKEMSRLMRWQHNKVVKTVNNKVYGLECHYKVRLTDESKFSLTGFHNKTVLLMAYKIAAHVMDIDPSECPNDDELDMLKM